MASKDKVNGEGSVFYISSRDVWRASKTVANLVNDDGSYGRPVRVSGEGSTKILALQRCDLNVLKWRVKHGADPIILKKVSAHAAPTVREYFTNYFAGLTALAPATRAQHEANYRLHIFPNIGEINLVLLSADDLEKLMGKINHLGESKRRAVYFQIKKGLDAAVKKKLIVLNPIIMVTAPPKAGPRSDSHKIQDWSQTAPQKIWKFFQNSDMEARWVLAFLGLRQSEVLGITLDSIHIQTLPWYIHVRQQLLHTHKTHGCGPWNEKTGKWPCGKPKSTTCPSPVGVGAPYLGPTKNKSSIRYLPLVEPFAEPILKQAKKQLELKKSLSWNPLPGLENLLFTSPEGRPMRQQSDSRAWNKLLKETGVEVVSGHVARHSAVTIMTNSGIPETAIQLLAGWSSLAEMKTYSHPAAIKLLGAPLRELGRELSKEL